MNRRLTVSAGLLGALACFGPDATAAQRTFVSSTGLDTNPCSLSAPCRNFQTAINLVDPGGEVVALSTAGYGAFVVTKSVSVIGLPGLYAGVTATTGNAVTVSAATDDVVVLRGLSITGAGASHGIAITGAGKVFVEDCTISGFAQDGINLATAAVLFVTGSTARQNGSRGLAATVTSGTARVVVDGSHFEGNGGAGLLAGQGSRVAVGGSVLSGNDTGAQVSSDGELSLQASQLGQNAGAGLSCPSSSGHVRATDLLVVKNGTGFSQAGTCLFDSLQDNIVRGNGTNVSGTISTVTYH